ncbi:alpha-glucan family phosphorylase [Nitrosophilus labii]|uniref:alpha-glucan family phosphorylase n=1 Tax=Nitrosophilus labii TaxID=2706014 RepID=UPI00165711B2|nr:alpha-glucan family phosphorylase [Nitrosophilus labii]
MLGTTHVYALFRDYLEHKKNLIEQRPLPIAYFCAEYGLHHSIPVYAGGLVFLAGDILIESSDMDLPIIGLGFMYPHGYIRQVIGLDGWQNGVSEPVDRDAALIERVLDKDLNHMILEVPYITPKVYVAVWKVNVGRVSLYLLDTDIEQNDPWDRHISSKLYTADLNQRVRQEIVLGIGGCRVLRALGIEYFILYLNEGHPAFALLERMRKFVEDGCDFEEARKIVEEGSIFTIHTSLQAATDVYSFDLMRRYFSKFAQDMKIDMEKLMSLGLNPDNPSSGFNMTALSL